jgi:DNA-binding PadR family transcriptional regulator
MNLTRLMALGILAQGGPAHGHHIRRVADVTNVGEWGGVSVGALYRELRTMEREGLIEATRTEKVGNRPERTVYAITAEGRLELSMLREQAIRQLEYGPDPVGVALLFTATEMDREELRRILRARRDIITIKVAEVAADRDALLAKGHVDELAAAIMRRAILHIEAEIRWHDEYDALLAAAGTGGAGGSGPGLPLDSGTFAAAAQPSQDSTASGNSTAARKITAPGEITAPREITARNGDTLVNKKSR